MLELFLIHAVDDLIVRLDLQFVGPISCLSEMLLRCLDTSAEQGAHPGLLSPPKEFFFLIVN
jgi:hypothetical protein